MEIIERNSPQLIVGLDSLDDSANYIHIADVKENINYYCPCCKGLIKPRAYKKDVDYQVQPHFYHETGGCSEETYIHYICKNWLFEKGCKFIINSIEYEVDHIEIEKTLHTSFGDYRPDIIVTTTTGKTFYFEIKVSNKKTELYAPKWDELGNDVVEVDARYFINQRYKNDIPEFNLIYSDGECFIKSYSRTDYEDTIAKRKLEWKRQDKLNYKIQWERLDWFWVEMQEYKKGNKTIDDVLITFTKLDLFDKEICFDLLKKQSCIKENNQKFRDIINIEVKEYWNNNAISLIGNEITFDYYSIEPRNHIEICYRFTAINRTCQSGNYSFGNQEWIVRPSIILAIIDGIIRQINYKNIEIQNKEKYQNVFGKVINKISNKFEFKGCIWFLDTFCYSLKIGIKNSHNPHHTETIYVDYNYFNSKSVFEDGIFKKKYDEVSFDNVYEFILENIEERMRSIYKYVSKYDGVNSVYRHMFISRNEVK